MDISLLISGNLTGFGRFYTSPAAAELLGSEKVSFDNHSFLPFLGNEEKAYSITFAKGFIAISQYSQILDSFRRPGKLVVSLLIPRNYTIVPKAGYPKGAVYSLLTKISERFFEKNFLDGMINQNLAVLGQDYYSDILDDYTLKPIDGKRLNIDPAPVKKVGYVRASELDMPSYLDSPYRKSYADGGYNLVIFAPSAPMGTPNSIDEEPEEVVLYKLRIKNTEAVLPNLVRLSDPLYKLQAKAGEKPFPIEGTYQDAIDHLLEPRITGRIMPGDIIELLYSFEQEEKTVKFVFVDVSTGMPVNLDLVLPSIIFSNGTRQPISSDTFTFHGSEIYDKKRIVAESPTFSISSRSESLDLSRSDGKEQKIYVQQGFSLFVKSPLLETTVSFVNKVTGQVLSFTNQNSINLSGRAADWDVYVDTKEYYAPRQSLVIQSNGSWSVNNLQRRGGGKKPEVPINLAGTPAVVHSGPQIIPRIGLGHNVAGSSSNARRKIRWHKYVILILALLLAGGGVWKLLSGFLDEEEYHQSAGGGFLGDGEEKKEMGLYLSYHDNDDKHRDILTTKTASDFSYTLLDNKGVEIIHDFRAYLDQESHPLLEETESQDGKYFRFHRLILNEYDQSFDYLTIRVSYICGTDTLQLVDCKIEKSSIKAGIENFDTIHVNLGIKLSQRKWYDELSNKSYQYSTEDEKKDRIEKIIKLGIASPSEFADSLLVHAQKRAYKRTESGHPSTPTPVLTVEEIPNLLKGNSWLTASNLREQYKKKKVPQNVYNRAQAMAKALDKVGKLKEAGDEGLDETQQITIQYYNNALKNEKYRQMLQGAQQRNQLTSFREIWALVEAWY